MNDQPPTHTNPRTAIILAAGMGTRLRSMHDQPKGLLEVGGEALVARSIRQLRKLGVERFVLVVGWNAPAYERAAEDWGKGIELVSNSDYASTGSLASLRLGAELTTGDVWLLESDLIYHPEALREVIACGNLDVILASGPTQTGDEVWVHTTDSGNLVSLTKTPEREEEPCGELVGICRLSRPLLDQLSKSAETLPPASHYEDGLTQIANNRKISVHLVENLAWGEIDSPEHYERVVQKVWPLIRHESESHS